MGSTPIVSTNFLKGEFKMKIYIVIEFDQDYCDNVAVFKDYEKARKFLIEMRKQAKRQNQTQEYMIEEHDFWDDLYWSSFLF